MYNKLFRSILRSSVWLQPDHIVRVWITFLAEKDEDGFARFATATNVSDAARVPPKKTQEAIAILEAPDPESSNPDNEGRRIQRVPGGWMVLNAKLYDNIAKREHEREMNAERVRRFRAKQDPTPSVDPPAKAIAPIDNAYELSLVAQFGECWADVASFLDTRSDAKRPAWAKEIGTLMLAYGPIVAARACNDALAAPDPIRMPAALRTICAGIREHSVRAAGSTSPASDDDKLMAWANEQEAKEQAAKLNGKPQ